MQHTAPWRIKIPIYFLYLGILIVGMKSVVMRISLVLLVWVTLPFIYRPSDINTKSRAENWDIIVGQVFLPVFILKIHREWTGPTSGLGESLLGRCGRFLDGDLLGSEGEGGRVPANKLNRHAAAILFWVNISRSDGSIHTWNSQNWPKKVKFIIFAKKNQNFRSKLSIVKE